MIRRTLIRLRNRALRYPLARTDLYSAERSWWTWGAPGPDAQVATLTLLGILHTLAEAIGYDLHLCHPLTTTGPADPAWNDAPLHLARIGDQDLGARPTGWRWWVHNLIAHPLVAVWPTLGWRLHDATTDDEDAPIVDDDLDTDPLDRSLVTRLRRLTPDHDAINVGRVDVSPWPGPDVDERITFAARQALAQATEFLRAQLEEVGLDAADYIVTIDDTPLLRPVDVVDRMTNTAGCDILVTRKGPACPSIDCTRGDCQDCSAGTKGQDLGAPLTWQDVRDASPVFDRPTPLTVDDTGHIEGHIATGPATVLRPDTAALAAAMDDALDLTEPEFDAIAVIAKLAERGWSVTNDAILQASADLATTPAAHRAAALHDEATNAGTDDWGPNPPQHLDELRRWAHTGWVYKADPRDLAQTIVRVIDRAQADVSKAIRHLIAAESLDRSHLADLAAGNVDPQDGRLDGIIKRRLLELDALPGLRARLAADAPAMVPAPADPLDDTEVQEAVAEGPAYAAIATTVAQGIASAHKGRLPTGPEGTHPLLPLAFLLDDRLRELIPDLDNLLPRRRPQWWLVWVAENEAHANAEQVLSRTMVTGGPSIAAGQAITFGADPEARRAAKAHAINAAERRAITDRPQA